ncbi:MAG: M48 family metallopeptidase [Methylococcales bacterium]
MRNKLLLILVASCVLTACAKSPMGRNQLMMMPDTQVNQMGLQAFTQLKQTKPVSRNPHYINFVNCVAHPLTQQVGEGAWEIVVFEDATLNAFALPGNKIGVHSGLVNMVDNPAELAAVIGHEIGHVLAKHTNERMSGETVTKQGMGLLGAVVGIDQSISMQLGMSALGLGLQYGVLMPYGRTHESEADVMGLDLMAKSGFDPRQSINLWVKMSQARNGQAQPEYLSTHPSDATRIDNLNQNMAGAMQEYQQAKAQGKHPNCSK